MLFLTLLTFGQNLKAGDLMRFMGQNYDQINDNLISRKYEFKGKEIKGEDFLSDSYKWEFMPKKFIRSKWVCLELRTYNEPDPHNGEKFQKYVEYTLFDNNYYLSLKNQFVQNGFIRSSSNTAKDDDGNTIIQSVYNKGLYELTITTFVNGQYKFSLFKWCTK